MNWSLSKDDCLLERGANPRTGLVTPAVEVPQGGAGQPQGSSKGIDAVTARWQQLGDQWVSFQPEPCGIHSSFTPYKPPQPANGSCNSPESQAYRKAGVSRVSPRNYSCKHAALVHPSERDVCNHSRSLPDVASPDTCPAMHPETTTPAVLVRVPEQSSNSTKRKPLLTFLSDQSLPGGTQVISSESSGSPLPKLLRKEHCKESSQKSKISAQDKCRISQTQTDPNSCDADHRRASPWLLGPPSDFSGSHMCVQGAAAAQTDLSYAITAVSSASSVGINKALPHLPASIDQVHHYPPNSILSNGNNFKSERNLCEKLPTVSRDSVNLETRKQYCKSELVPGSSSDSQTHTNFLDISQELHKRGVDMFVPVYDNPPRTLDSKVSPHQERHGLRGELVQERSDKQWTSSTNTQQTLATCNYERTDGALYQMVGPQRKPVKNLGKPFPAQIGGLRNASFTTAVHRADSVQSTEKAGDKGYETNTPMSFGELDLRQEPMTRIRYRPLNLICKYPRPSDNGRSISQAGNRASSPTISNLSDDLSKVRRVLEGVPLKRSGHRAPKLHCPPSSKLLRRCSRCVNGYKTQSGLTRLPTGHSRPNRRPIYPKTCIIPCTPVKNVSSCTGEMDLGATTTIHAKSCDGRPHANSQISHKACYINDYKPGYCKACRDHTGSRPSAADSNLNHNSRGYDENMVGSTNSAMLTSQPESTTSTSTKESTKTGKVFIVKAALASTLKSKVSGWTITPNAQDDQGSGLNHLPAEDQLGHNSGAIAAAKKAIGLEQLCGPIKDLKVPPLKICKKRAARIVQNDKATPGIVQPCLTPEKQHLDSIPQLRKTTPLAIWTKTVTTDEVNCNARQPSTDKARPIQIAPLTDMVIDVVQLAMVPWRALHVLFDNHPELESFCHKVVGEAWRMICVIQTTTQQLVMMLYLYSKTGKIRLCAESGTVEFTRDLVKSALFLMVFVMLYVVLSRVVRVLLWPLSLLVAILNLIVRIGGGMAGSSL